MPQVFFTADTHFGDPRVRGLDKRPFASIAVHDEALIARWNAAVAPGDTVYHLGDVCRGRLAATTDLLDRLNGEKHLVTGNNDGPETLRALQWASVSTYLEIEEDGRPLVLCHYAFRSWNGIGKGAIDLHGHSHGRLKPMVRQFDVGVDVWDYRPVTLAEMLASRTRRRAASAASDLR